MIEELMQRMIERYSRETLHLIIPQAFESLEGSDVDFEIVSSQTLSDLTLTYKHGIVTHSIALVFYTNRWYGRRENRHVLFYED